MDARQASPSPTGVSTAATPGDAEVLRTERTLLEQIVRDAPLPVVLREMAEAMERLLPEVLVSVLVADSDGRHLRHGAAPSLPEFYNQAIDGIAVADGVGSCGTAAYRRAPVIVVDIATAPSWTDFRELAAQAGVSACWSTPLLTHEGVLLGTLAMYHRQPRTPQRSDMELSAAFARTAGLAIERHRILQARASAEARERAAREDLRFILAASTEIAGTLDQQQIMERVAALSVPALAPMCVVTVRESHRPRQVVAAAVLPSAKIALLHADDEAVERIMSSGHTEARIGYPAEAGPWPELGVTSHVCIPLSERGTPFGTLTLLGTEQHPIDARTIALAEELARRAAISAGHAQQYADRVQAAHDLQAGLLLHELPHPPGAALATSYTPAGTGLEVGGDFYDVFPLGDGRWAFVIGDVCGRGALAASTTGLVRHTTRAVARLLSEPSAVVDAVNSALLDRAAKHGSGFVTLIYGQFRQVHDGLDVELLRAGHLPPLLRRADGTVDELHVSGRLLGIFAQADPTILRLTLRSGDSLVLMTDGITEARNRHGELFGEQRAAAALTAIRSPITPQLLVDALGNAVKDFAAHGDDQSDDSATLIITAT